MKEFTETEKLISRLTGMKGLADRSCESTDVSSEILQLCDDGVTSEIYQKCIDILDSLSRENLELSAKLKSIEAIIEDTADDGTRDDKWAMDEINHICFGKDKKAVQGDNPCILEDAPETTDLGWTGNNDI